MAVTLLGMFTLRRDEFAKALSPMYLTELRHYNKLVNKATM